MARQRVIVGIGEAVLCEYPDRVEPGGLAVGAAIHAAQLGHRGVVVSRVGQDPAADDLMQRLRGTSVNIDAMQSDPDLATGRMIIRTIGKKTTRTLTARAAFDNLQWDFDLVDVAQQADGVIFGQLARREGQSQSIIKRFLAECTGAMRVFDLTNRPPGVESVDRIDARTGLEFAEGLVADAVSLKALAPGWSGQDARAAAVEIMRGSDLAFVVSIEHGDCTELMSIHSQEGSTTAALKYPAAQHAAAVVGLLHGVLSGWDFARSLDIAVQLAEHAAKHPNEPLPQ